MIGKPGPVLVLFDEVVDGKTKRGYMSAGDNEFLKDIGYQSY